MKIEADLRIAIRSAVKAHNDTCNKTNFWKEREKAVKALAAQPRYKAKLAKARARLDAALEECQKARETFGALGINADLDRVDNEDRFKKAGGILPHADKTLNPDVIIAQIARADRKEANAIIKCLDIRWE